MSLLTLEGIYKEFNSRVILDAINLSVHRGERLALVGENGCGKTTLLRIAMGEESSDRGRVIVGRGVKIGYLTQSLNEIIPNNSQDTAMNYEKVSGIERKLRKIEEEMSQYTDEEELRLRMVEYSRLTEEYESLDGYNVEAKIKQTLLGLGLREEALMIPIDKLSGGEKMRVALARILLEEPELLVLDEPTNHLDIKAVEWLENFLKNYKGGVLIVSHDRYFLDQITTRVAELHQGTIMERSGNYSSYIKQKQIRREFILTEKKRLQREIKESDQLVKKFMGMRKIKAARSREKEKSRLVLEYSNKIKASQSEHLHKNSRPLIDFAKARHVSADIAWAKRLNKKFDDVVLFSEASFNIYGGERIGIIGPNGCGKTTLLNILLGKDAEFSGEAALGSWVKYGYLGQEIFFEDEGRTIIEELLMKKDMLEKEAKRYLARYQFYGDEVNKKIEVLSGGEKVRVYLATMMLEEPYCIIMDEPTNHLDMTARNALESALLNFRGTVIAISHDRYFLNRCISRILEISDGKVISYTGNYQGYKEAKARMDEKTKVTSESDKSKGAKPSKINALSQQTVIKEKELKLIEQKINILEDRIKELEQYFGPEAGISIYKEYDELSKELQELYQKWEQLQVGG